ncbi:hypothetical protein F3Y22_tig00117056pilonHSYRG00273 [Hibiscus syriacus]|uniref:Uncharacterized protein n=1 Tax=Hibiscus syriacus TaxID=106335 RepID=A0A6A2XAS5_HIBSY|nr:hypothetical protein F3Y22_tig00117056pilonHSYRG00273 [Hibiscus syriacus]
MADYGQKYAISSEKEKLLIYSRRTWNILRASTMAETGVLSWGSMNFVASHTGYNMQDNLAMSESTSFLYEKFSDAPASFDWRDKGAVTSVKNQGRCDTWGEHGFMRIQRGADTPGGLCGIAMKGSFPVA